MRLPYLKNIEQVTTRDIMEFRGINYSSVRNPGEFADSKNISLDAYPCLTQRKPRSVLMNNLTAPTAIFSKNGNMSYVDGTDFYFNGTKKGTLSAGKKQITSVGDRIIIFPDKCYYDISEGKFGTLHNSYVSGAGQITFAETTITTTGPDFADFRKGDAIKISGGSIPANNITAIITGVAAKTLTFAAKTFTAGASSTATTIAREIPDMDYICEYNNRLWGCKNNSIYASKQGDPFNFYYYAGVSIDSFAVDVGSDGNFTGITGYTSHLVLFKENYIHKMFGVKPANFQLTTSQCAGLQPGCERSVAILNDTIFYKSRIGIMAYAGNIPELVSQNLGQKNYIDAIGDVEGQTYYVSMNTGTKWELLAYNSQHNIWVKEDDTHVADFTFHNNRLCYLNAEDKKVYAISEDNLASEIIRWMVDFGELNEGINNPKTYVRFFIHAELEVGSTLRVSINCDRKGWKEIYFGMFEARKTVRIPVVPTKCDIFSMKVEGSGKSRIFSVTKEVQQRGEK